MGHKRKHRKQRNAALQAAAQQANTELNLPPPPEFIADVGKGESRSTGIVTIPEIEQQYRDREAQALAAQQQLVAAGDALQAKQLAFEEEQKRVATEAAAREDALAAELRAAGGRGGKRRGYAPTPQEGEDELPPVEAELPAAAPFPVNKALAAVAVLVAAYYFLGR